MSFDPTALPSTWTWREPTLNRAGKLYKAVRRHAHKIVGGTLLVVDPSIGSKRAGKEGGSEPGYAIYRAGVLVDHGVLEIRGTASSHQRLHEISRSLREDFGGEKWDVLVIEAIPHLRFETFGRSLSSQLPLHWACGAIMGAVTADLCVQVAPQTWHAFAPEGYVKTDWGDAICMGRALLQYARAASVAPRKKKKKVKRSTSTNAVPVSGTGVQP